MSWVVEESCMIFLLLKRINLVFPTANCCRYVMHFVMAFLLVIRGCRHFPLIGLSIVYLHAAEFRPHMLKTNTVKPDTSNLHFQILIITEITSFIKLSVYLFFYCKFLKTLRLSSSRLYLLSCKFW